MFTKPRIFDRCSSTNTWFLTEHTGIRNDVILTDASDSAVITSAINSDDEAVWLVCGISLTCIRNDNIAWRFLKKVWNQEITTTLCKTDTMQMTVLLSTPTNVQSTITVLTACKNFRVELKNVLSTHQRSMENGRGGVQLTHNGVNVVALGSSSHIPSSSYMIIYKHLSQSLPAVVQQVMHRVQKMHTSSKKNVPHLASFYQTQLPLWMLISISISYIQVPLTKTQLLLDIKWECV
jgi:hypothetical protein